MYLLKDTCKKYNTSQKYVTKNYKLRWCLRMSKVDQTVA